MTDEERKLWIDVFMCKVQHHHESIETSANMADQAVKRLRKAIANTKDKK